MAMLEVKDLHVHYGVIEAIKGIDFEVNKGEIIALIGANGAGKTTILHTVTGLIQPTKGTIVFEGKDIKRRDIRSYRLVWHMYQKEEEFLHSFPYMKIC